MSVDEPGWSSALDCKCCRPCSVGHESSLYAVPLLTHEYHLHDMTMICVRMKATFAMSEDGFLTANGLQRSTEISWSDFADGAAGL